MTCDVFSSHHKPQQSTVTETFTEKYWKGLIIVSRELTSRLHAAENRREKNLEVPSISNSQDGNVSPKNCSYLSGPTRARYCTLLIPLHHLCFSFLDYLLLKQERKPQRKQPELVQTAISTHPTKRKDYLAEKHYCSPLNRDWLNLISGQTRAQGRCSVTERVNSASRRHFHRLAN